MTPDDLLKRLARSGPTSVATSGRPTNLSSSSWPWDALRTAGNGSFPMRTWSHTCANCCETSCRPGRLCIPCSRFDGCSPMNCGRFPGSRNSPRTRAETSGEPSTRSCGNIFPSPFTGRSARRPTFPETGRRGMLKSRQRNRRCANGRAARRPSIRPSRDAGVATHGSAIRCSTNTESGVRSATSTSGSESDCSAWKLHTSSDIRMRVPTRWRTVWLSAFYITRPLTAGRSVGARRPDRSSTSPASGFGLPARALCNPHPNMLIGTAKRSSAAGPCDAVRHYVLRTGYSQPNSIPVARSAASKASHS